MTCALCNSLVGLGFYVSSKGEPVHYWCEQRRVQDGTQQAAKAIKRGERRAS